MANQSDCCHEEKISQQADHGKQDQFQVSLTMVQAISSDSNPMLHPTPCQRTHPTIAPSHIWRIPMRKRMGGLLRTHLQPSNHHLAQ